MACKYGLSIKRDGEVVVDQATKVYAQDIPSNLSMYAHSGHRYNVFVMLWEGDDAVAWVVGGKADGYRLYVIGELKEYIRSALERTVVQLNADVLYHNYRGELLSLVNRFEPRIINALSCKCVGSERGYHRNDDPDYYVYRVDYGVCVKHKSRLTTRYTAVVTHVPTDYCRLINALKVVQASGGVDNALDFVRDRLLVQVS